MKLWVLTDNISCRICISTVQKKNLIESMKIFCLKDFLWFKKWFIWIKKTKNNQINFGLKEKKNLTIYKKNAIICLFWRKIYLILTNIYLTRRYFVWIKKMLFNSSQSFLWNKKSLLNKLFSFIQSNLFRVHRKIALSVSFCVR